ncbi:MAG: CaiB/BaiF CoA-transferase family protein [Rhodospirillaceae bacterium]
MTRPPRPLEGVRVLDASHVVAGPFATYQLCLMGAEAVRVERLGGDDFVRVLGGTKDMIDAGLGSSFVSQNAGKRCILMDLRAPGAREVFLKLAAQSDVLMENYRPGAFDRMGVGYGDVRKVKPDIVYCSLTGYGPEGPLSNAPAYDHIVQGMSGLMSMNGTDQSGPMRVGLPITDYIAGLTAALAISGALHQKAITGRGQNLIVPMLSSVLAFMGAMAVDRETSGVERGLKGNLPFSGSPFAGRFDTADGHIVITANTPAQATRMVDAMNLPGLKDMAVRLSDLNPAERADIATALQKTFRTGPADQWEDILDAAGVPAGKVRNLGEIMAHPQTAAMGTLDHLPMPGMDTPLTIPGLGFTSDAWDRAPLSEPEVAGASTREVLSGLGYSDAEIETLALAGAVAGPGLPEKDT